MSLIRKQLAKLNQIFSENDRYKAHELSRSILTEMAKDQNHLFEVIANEVKKEGFFNQNRINPVLAYKIEENQDFSIVAHAFMHLPDRNTDITHQSIHHHGNLLLSTINCFGEEGYESMLFNKGFEIQGEEARMSLKKQYKNKLHHYEFIDSHSPHVVFYPKDICITYAMWSTDKKGAAEGLKKLAWLKPFKSQLRNLISHLGLAKALNLNEIKFLDFYPKDGRVIPMKERVRYPESNQEDFIANSFYLWQQIGWNDTELLEMVISKQDDETQKMLVPYWEKFKAGIPLEASIAPQHLNIEKVNIPRIELDKAFPKS